MVTKSEREGNEAYKWQQTGTCWRLFRGDLPAGKVMGADFYTNYIRWCSGDEPLSVPCHQGFDDIEAAKADCLRAVMERFGDPSGTDTLRDGLLAAAPCALADQAQELNMGY